MQNKGVARNGNHRRGLVIVPLGFTLQPPLNMSEQPKANDNVAPVQNQKYGYNIIRTAMIGGFMLAGLFGTAILVFSPENLAVGVGLVSSAVTGPLTFIAGRKS